MVKKFKYYSFDYVAEMLARLDNNETEQEKKSNYYYIETIETLTKEIKEKTQEFAKYIQIDFDLEMNYNQESKGLFQELKIALLNVGDYHEPIIEFVIQNQEIVLIENSQMSIARYGENDHDQKQVIKYLPKAIAIAYEIISEFTKKEPKGE
jgi:hypothetical protein